MATDLDGEYHRATESWDQLFRQLSASPRRRILLALMKASPEEDVSLPDDIIVTDGPVDRERMTIELCHHHLPSLAEDSYIEWETSPLTARRGPRFHESEVVLRTLLDAHREYPHSLWNDAVEQRVIR